VVINVTLNLPTKNPHQPSTLAVYRGQKRPVERPQFPSGHPISVLQCNPYGRSPDDFEMTVTLPCLFPHNNNYFILISQLDDKHLQIPSHSCMMTMAWHLCVLGSPARHVGACLARTENQISFVVILRTSGVTPWHRKRTAQPLHTQSSGT